MIYLDNAATTWPKPEEVYIAVNNCLRGIGGNPGRGVHGSSRAASYILYEAREALAKLFNISQPTNIAFAYNATDALNTILLGALTPGDHVVTTSMEHNAVTRPLRFLEQKGVKVTVVASDPQGYPDLLKINKCINDGAKAIVISHASNVTGTIMPVAEIGEMTAPTDCLLIVDAAQTAGVENIDVQQMKIDILTFSGHKGLFGPQGTGGFYVKNGININPLRYGGTGSISESDIQPDFMPDKFESGTPNTPGIAGLLAGVRYILSVGTETIRAKEIELSKLLIDGLNSITKTMVYGPNNIDKRTAVVSFNVAGLDSGEIAHRLDVEFQIACRSGLHCAPWAHKTIGTLKTGTIRFSPGFYNTKEEIYKALEAVMIVSERRE